MSLIIWFLSVLFFVTVCFAHNLGRVNGWFSETSDDKYPKKTVAEPDFNAFTATDLLRHKVKDVDQRLTFGLNRFFPNLGDGIEYCTRPAKCSPLNYTTCMGIKLPYSQTSLVLGGVSSQEHAQDLLREWRRLIHIPKCWGVIQPFLCAVYMPRCEDGKVYLPSQEMCRTATMHCRILSTYISWPPWFQCENSTRFPPMCKNDIRGLKFNTTGSCLEPLVHTDQPSSYYDGVDGCAVQCENPLFSPDEHEQIHKMIAWVASVCAILNTFAVLTFIIDWRHFSKYPTLAIFYINLCFLIVCLGWLVQFLPGVREDVVCRKDGTLRTAEPSAGENLSCVVVFVMVYYFLIAGIVWFAIFTYAWNLSLQALEKIQDCMEKKGAVCHMIAWSVPLVFTILTMFFCKIDGDSITGICFVGNTNRKYRLFLLVPVIIVLIISSFFLSRGLVTLIRLKMDSERIMPEKASAQIQSTILKIGVRSALLLIFSIITFICHYIEGKNMDEWDESFRHYMLCKLGVPQLDSEECRMESRPSLAMMQVHILTLFLTGFVMSSWVWTHITYLTWYKFLRNDQEGNIQPPRLKKHRIIARAFAKRKMWAGNSKLSITLYSTHQDPAGLKFDLNNSEGSASMRSSWAAAVDKFVLRRDALVGTTNSVDSEISYSVRRVSVESRRNSVDSAVSVKVSEVTQTLVKKVKTPYKGSHRSRRRSKTRNRNRHNKQDGNNSSGDESKDLVQKNKIVMDMPSKNYLPDLNMRRPANVGLEGDPMAFFANQFFIKKCESSTGSSSTTSSSPPLKDP